MASKYTNVAVHNRGNFPITNIQFDGDPIEWGPRETKHLPMDIAAHCIRKSAVRWDPITQTAVHTLIELRPEMTEAGVDEISYFDAHPDQLLDTSNMDPTSFDSEGRPLRGEIKHLATPTGMMSGRIPAGASMGVPRGLKGAAGEGLGAAAAMPAAMEERFDQAHDKLIDGIGT